MRGSGGRGCRRLLRAALFLPLGATLVHSAVLVGAGWPEGPGLAAVCSGLAAIGFLLVLPVVLLRTSSSPAAPPLALFYASVSVFVFRAIVELPSDWLDRYELVAMVAAPCALAHLLLLFPLCLGLDHLGQLVAPVVHERPATSCRRRS